MKPFKLLIIDDQPQYLESIVHIVEKAEEPFEILQATNGLVGLSISRKHQPDIIITDWDMPRMDGIAMMKELQKDKKLKDIPVIVCSGVMTSSKNLRTALNAGAVDYIRKPIDETELIARLQAMLRLSQSYKRIEKLSRNKDKILSVVTHDLKNAVGGVYSLITLMREDEGLTKKEFMELLRHGEVNMGYSYTMLENLLNWARNQMSRYNYSPSEQVLSYLCKSVEEMLQPRAGAKGVKIELDCPEGLAVYADEQMMTSILRNLLGNAIKFTPKGGKTHLAVRRDKDDILVEVSDTGVGISQEAIAQILDRTETFTTYDTDKRKGSGIGLQIVMDFLEKHDTSLQIKSDEGKGSTFYFRLPEM